MTLPGFDFASAIRSLTSFAGRAGFTTTRLGSVASSATGAKSAAVSYGSFGIRLAFTAWPTVTTIRL